MSPGSHLAGVEAHPVVHVAGARHARLCEGRPAVALHRVRRLRRRGLRRAVFPPLFCCTCWGLEFRVRGQGQRQGLG